MTFVRPAVPEDINPIIEIARHSATAGQWNPKEYEKLFADALRVTLVIGEKGKVAGFIVARAIADEWEIENVAVTETARRRGLGSHLLGEFLDLAQTRGAKRVFLEVRESNQEAQALYKKRGFTEAGRRQSYYQNPSEDALIFRFSFPQ
jgi:ribosomal-protein-alanine acetyltransferase